MSSLNFDTRPNEKQNLEKRFVGFAVDTSRDDETKQQNRNSAMFNNVEKPKAKVVEEHGELDKSVTSVTIEGFNQMKTSRTMCAKMFWATLLTFSAFMAAYFVYKTIYDYYTSPISTAYSIVAKDAMDFPQLYICPSNPIRKSYLDQYPDKVKQAGILRNSIVVKEDAGHVNANGTRPARSVPDFDEDWIPYDQNRIFFNNPIPNAFQRFKRSGLPMMANNTSIINGTNIENSTTTITPKPVYPNDTADYMNQVFMDMGVVENDFFIFCQFRSFFLNMIPCKLIYKPVLDPNYGKCFVIDLGDRKQAVPAQGLTLILNLKTQEYSEDPAYSPRYTGLLVSVGKPYDPTNLEKVLIPPKTYTKVDITEQHLQFLNVKSGPSKQLCNDADEFPYAILNITYSQSSCQTECMMRTVAKKCNCILTIDKMFLLNGTLGKYHYCTLSEANECVKTKVTESDEAAAEIKDCSDNCYIPCDVWRYNMRVSSMPLFKPAFPKFPPNSTIDDFIYVQFAFPYLEYEEFTQSESMSIDDMIGNIGGNIGLWLGASMLTLIQIPITLFTLSTWYCYKRSKPIVKDVGRRLTSVY